MNILIPVTDYQGEDSRIGKNLHSENYLIYQDEGSSFEFYDQKKIGEEYGTLLSLLNERRIGHVITSEIQALPLQALREREILVFKSGGRTATKAVSDLKSGILDQFRQEDSVASCTSDCSSCSSSCSGE